MKVLSEVVKEMPGTDFSYTSIQKTMLPNQIQSHVLFMGHWVVDEKGTEKG